MFNLQPTKAQRSIVILKTCNVRDITRRVLMMKSMSVTYFLFFLLFLKFFTCFTKFLFNFIDSKCFNFRYFCFSFLQISIYLVCNRPFTDCNDPTSSRNISCSLGMQIPLHLPILNLHLTLIILQFELVDHLSAHSMHF